MYEADEYLVDEMEDEGDEDDIVGQKDWFGPALASMARLNQIQANVYTMGLHNPTVLKPTKKIRQNHQKQEIIPTQPPTPQLRSVIAEEKQEEDNGPAGDVSSRKAQPSPLHKETAWESNHSIPELIARQATIRAARPSSAKILNECRLKTASMLRGRPQSAKEPLCKNETRRKRQGLGVMGSKKNMSSKPPPRVVAPIEKHPSTDKAWAGLPPGYKMHPIQVMEDDTTKQRGESPMVPCSSPVFSDDESIEGTNHKTPSLLRRPLPPPIHLSLPSADDVLDVIGDEDDQKQEPDTDRLLQEADNYMKNNKNAQKQESEPSLQSRNATLPEVILAPASPHSNSNVTQNSNSNNSRESVWTSQNQHSSQKALSKNETSNENKSESNSAFDQSQHSTDKIVSEKSQLSTKTREETLKQGVKIREDRNITVDITPRNLGRKVVDKNTTVVNKAFPNSDGHTHNHTRCSCDINLEDLSLTDRERKDLQQYQKNKRASRKPPKDGLVSMVTVEYEEGDQTEKEKKVTPKRKKKPMSEIETLVSQLSLLDSDVQDSNADRNGAISVCDLLHKSLPEKNYYEIARNKSQGSLQSVSQSEIMERMPLSHSDGNVYKTTKTVEFGMDNLVGASAKSAICSQVMPKVKKESIHASYTIRPAKQGNKSTINETLIQHNDAATVSSDENKTENQQLEMHMEGLEDMLLEAKAMAKNSISDASKSRPPSGRASLSSNRSRPSSSKENRTKTESKPKARPPLVRSSSLSDINKCIHKPQTQFVSNTFKKCFRHSARLPPPGAKSSVKQHTEPVIITTARPHTSYETQSSLHCKEMRSRMSELGLNIDSDLLERALYPPSGHNLYYNIPGELPKSPTDGLLTHYKNWLPEEYKRVKMMEKRLAEDDHIRYLQELAAKKKAKKAAVKVKGKKGKKKKLLRRNSVS